ncbi:MAG: RNA-guided endonuclease IscB [Galactobacillus timonensis]|uniref:RNA-guided endonuclease IscB n=1 Tax=Galactobacillus timonensis TaxID=2041840 RepID=UPI002409D9E3|nr:RNA-guided endonuclease IscB [Galactobacillus timonensis]MDD5851397.1 RNA-guided endonuclease IscB [Galactobacillus timonensis]MDD6599383.1 RNA-guided endonuclease IscB [Galactobacillus timonensis]
MSVAVLSSTGRKLMPTSNYRARKLLKGHRATIECYRPIFTIRLTDRAEGETQPIEYACDTGYQHVGVSIKSEKHEFVHAQYDMLSDETERYNNCRQYRRSRRNRKRYRKARFNNRSKKNKDMAPSLRHRKENQNRLFESFCKVMPITTATFEMGKFDTQLLQAIADGKPLPEGKDYQRGNKYLFQTEREAVFARDNYTCQVCGKSVKDDVVLHTHHVGFWKNYRSNRISNLLTVCGHCHTAKNHKPGGKLWGLEPKNTNLASATYMSTVRWAMYRELVLMHPEIDINIQYGAKTSVTRKSLHLSKTHANDAYCIGSLHPKHRTAEAVYQKKRRNNRILAKFYDAKYIDVRDGKKKSGAVLSCGRTNRRESRWSDKNRRIFRGKKCSRGRVSVRKVRYAYQPGDTVIFRNQKVSVVGAQHYGQYVSLNGGKSAKTSDLICMKKEGGWHFRPAHA